MVEICPNCHQYAPGGLYSNDIYEIEHCGCFWEGEPKEVEFHISREPLLTKEEKEEFGLMNLII